MSSVHAVRPGQRVVTLQSKRNSHEVVVTERSVEQIQELADEMGELADDLKAAAAAALGEECLHLENVLRLELGHDISTDIG